MKVTTVMLADHATVREGLLHVLGGGITRIMRDPLPAQLGVVLALMLQADDPADFKKVHDLGVSVSHIDSGKGESVAKAVLTVQPLSEIGPGPLPYISLVVPLQGVPIMETGVHEISVRLDGEMVAVVQFEVVKAELAQTE